MATSAAAEESAAASGDVAASAAAGLGTRERVVTPPEVRDL